MQNLRKFVVLVLVLVVGTAGSAFAGQQPHILSPSQLSEAMAEKVASRDADRAAVREALARPEVKNVAAGLGVDMNRLTASVDTLDAADLGQAASTARQINQQLVGGDSTVTLSTTTIIIALLILILIIVAVH
jgi:hypothetical protein